MSGTFDTPARRAAIAALRKTLRAVVIDPRLAPAPAPATEEQAA